MKYWRARVELQSGRLIHHNLYASNLGIAMKLLDESLTRYERLCAKQIDMYIDDEPTRITPRPTSR